MIPRPRRHTDEGTAGELDPVAEQPLLDAELLRQLERLRFRTLTAIVGGLVGEREGRAGAARHEFAEYRPYVAGDELRRIDWNVYRRLHQLVVKVGIEDARLSIALLIDTSRSMRVGRPGALHAAQRLAAILAAIALLRGDRVDVHAIGDGHAQLLVGLDGPRQLALLQDELERLSPSVATGLADALTEYTGRGAQTDVAILLSDAHVDREDLERALRLLASAGRAAGVVHVFAADEVTILPLGPVELRDAESGRTIEATIDEAAAAAYAERFAAFSNDVRDLCGDYGVGYVRAPSNEDPLDVLLAHAAEAAISVA